MRSASLLCLVAILSGCPSPTVEKPDGGSGAADTGADGGALADAAADATPTVDAAIDDDAAEADAADQDARAGDADPGPDVTPPRTCPAAGRRHVILGTAQNPRMVTFGRGLPTERTVEVHGAYLASFGPTGCFEWVARTAVSIGVLSATELDHDADGNLYFGFSLPSEIAFHDADDRLTVTYTGTVATSTSVRPAFRGVLVGSYDRRGHLRWVERIGNAEQEPRTKGYTIESLQLTDGVLRVSTTANGGQGAAPYDAVFGAGQPTETRVRVAATQHFSALASLDPATGALLANSVRVNAAVTTNANRQLRHEGTGHGEAAANGDFALGIIAAGPTAYQLNRGEPDVSTFSTSSSLVAVFAHYTRLGAVAWRRLAGDAEGEMTVFATAILADGSSLFSGNAAEGAGFEDGAALTRLAPTAQGYLVRYDGAGNLVWLRGISARGVADILVDEGRNAFYAVGIGGADTTFGVGDPDAVTAELRGVYLAGFALDTGALTWIRHLATASGGFTDLTLSGDEIVLSTRFDGAATFEPNTPQELQVRGAFTIWSGQAVYGAADGAFRGVIEDLSHDGSSNEGLHRGVILEP